MSNFPDLDEFESGSATVGGGAVLDTEEFTGRFPSLDGADTVSSTSAPAPPSNFPSIEDDDDDFGGFGVSPATKAVPARADVDFVGGFEREPVPIPVAEEAVHDEVSAFKSQFPELSAAQSQTNGVNYGSSPYSQPAPKTAPSVPVFDLPPEPESDAIREWRDKFRNEVRARDEASAAKHEQVVNKAEQAIDDFYASYSAKKERQIAKNKEAEASFQEAQTDALAKGSTWERIASLVDLQDSRSKTNTRSARDLARYRELLLTLKREGDSAPGAAGF